MKKWFALVLTLLLILILSYFCFTNKSKTIEHDLLSKVNNAYAQENMSWVNIKGLEGSHFKQTRILILEGRAQNQTQRKKAELIANNIEGIHSVKNYITIPYNEHSFQAENEITKKEKPIYKLSISKEKDCKVVLIKGVVPNKKIHNQLITKAKELFGKINIIDELEENQGTAKNWHKSIKLGMQELHKVKYGHFQLKNNEFKFEGYVNNKEKRAKLLKHLEKNLAEGYVGNYNIETPKIEISCQKEIYNLLSKNKIYFQYNKTYIKKESYLLLNNIANVVKTICLEEFIVIEGHTDSLGEKNYNLQLSKKRANSVKNYLIKQGVKKNRIEVIGYGESRPIGSNKTKKGQKENRRIEFKIKVLK